MTKHRTCVEMAAVSCGNSRVTTKQRCKYIIWVDIQHAPCKATVTHSQLHMTRAQWVCSEAENSAMQLPLWSTSGSPRDEALKKCSYNNNNLVLMLFWAFKQPHRVSHVVSAFWIICCTGVGTSCCHRSYTGVLTKSCFQLYWCVDQQLRQLWESNVMQCSTGVGSTAVIQHDTGVGINCHAAWHWCGINRCHAVWHWCGISCCHTAWHWCGINCHATAVMQHDTGVGSTAMQLLSCSTTLVWDQLLSCSTTLVWDQLLSCSMALVWDQLLSCSMALVWDQLLSWSFPRSRDAESSFRRRASSSDCLHTLIWRKTRTIIL